MIGNCQNNTSVANNVHNDPQEYMRAVSAAAVAAQQMGNHVGGVYYNNSVGPVPSVGGTGGVNGSSHSPHHSPHPPGSPQLNPPGSPQSPAGQSSPLPPTPTQLTTQDIYQNLSPAMSPQQNTIPDIIFTGMYTHCHTDIIFTGMYTHSQPDIIFTGTEISRGTAHVARNRPPPNFRILTYSLCTYHTHRSTMFFMTVWQYISISCKKIALK